MKLRGKVLIIFLAVLVNSAVIFTLPFIKYVNKYRALEADTADSKYIKITKVSLEEKKKKIKKVKVKTSKPKLARRAQADNRFKLDFGIGGFGAGAAISAGDSANIIYDEGSVDVDPVRVSGKNPEVPDAFVAAGLEGRVELQVVIEANGNVSEVEVILEDPPNYQLGRAAAVAMRSWKYRPATIKNIPVRIRVIVPFIFS